MTNLVIAETHPVQYHAPVYRAVHEEHGVQVSLLYGSDFSVVGYRDAEFGTSFAWDTDLLGGVNHRFLNRMTDGGSACYEQVSGAGVASALAAMAPRAIMGLGYAHPFDRAVLDAARSLNVPLLFRGETSDHAQQRSWLKRLIRDLLLRRLYARCAALLFVGERSQQHFRRLGVPEQKLFFSPYCVESKTFHLKTEDKSALRRETRAQWGIAQDELVIIFSGKLSERKGVDLIPGAVRSLPHRGRVHLLFLGDGALRRQLETDCAQVPFLKATFAGFQNQSALSGFYHAADLLVLPSRANETWGLVVNEAMLHGLPCVVSHAVGSQPDLVLPGMTGEVCIAGDQASLAQALERCLDLAAASATATRCRELVAKYSIRAAASGIALAIRSLH